MDSYIVSQEVAAKLKEAGYPQKSTVLVWWHSIDHKPKEWFWAKRSPVLTVDRGREILAAPLSDELIAQLPKSVIIGTYNNAPCVVAEYRYGESSYFSRSQDLRVSHALAELWIKLKENGLLEA